MTSYTKLSQGSGGLNGAVAELFRSMLEKRVVDAVLIPSHQPHGSVAQTLVSDPTELNGTDPFAPVVPVNSAKIVSALTAVPSGRPVAAVMRSCEVKALVELAKLKQVFLDDLVLVGIDCLGRYENNDFRKLDPSPNGSATEAFLKAALAGQPTQSVQGFDIAPGCRICESPVPDNVDLRLCVIGGKADSIWLEWVTEKGAAVREKLALEAADSVNGRQEAVATLTEQRTKERDKVLAEIRGQVTSFDELAGHLAGCINCYNCRVACPVCYCRECVFVTDTFRHAGDQYMNWADKRGALKMPTDTLFYHLTRMVHMSTLCVGCGQCESACPNDIPLVKLFRAIGEKTQARFDYHPGRSLEEEQPLATFHDDELTEVTGQVK